MTIGRCKNFREICMEGYRQGKVVITCMFDFDFGNKSGGKF